MLSMGAGLIDDFICRILVIPFCPYHFVQYHFVPIPFCPYHFVRYILSVPFCPRTVHITCVCVCTWKCIASYMNLSKVLSPPPNLLRIIFSLHISYLPVFSRFCIQLDEVGNTVW